MSYSTVRMKFALCANDGGAWGDEPGSDSATPVLRSTEITLDGRIEPEDAALRKLSAREIKATSVRNGDILVVKSSGSDAHLGKSGWVDERCAGMSFSNFIQRLRVSHRFNSRFTWYFMNCNAMKEQVRVLSSTTTGLQNLSGSLIGQIEVPCPPVDEQRRIADFLDAETARIDRLAALRTSQMEALTTHYQSQLSELAQVLCDRYGTVKVRHVLQRIEQGWSPQCEDRTIMNGEWGVVKAGCVNGGVFDGAKHKALPTGTKPELRYRLRPGDLLMSRASGSVDLIGSIAVLPDDLPSQLLLCDKVYRLRMDRTRMTPHFVAYMLRTLEVREQIKLGISGAEGMANNLPTATVTNLPLPDVPLVEQGNVVSDLNESWRAVHNTTQMLKGVHLSEGCDISGCSGHAVRPRSGMLAGS